MLEDMARRLGLGADAIVEPAPGGASGTAWVVRTSERRCVLRLSASSLTDGRLSAMAAARAGNLPAPELIRRASGPDTDAVLLSWLPGRSLHETLLRDPAGWQRWGREMGETQRRLHEIDGPGALIDVLEDAAHPFGAGRAIRGLPDGSAILHLDWHPLNLLVDEGRGRVCGIVDWDNARRGHPLLDLARTHSLLTVEPSLASLPEPVRARLDELVGAWAEGYGPLAHAIPPECHAWAGRVMLADLEDRYAATPAALDALRRWTEGWETTARTG